MHKFSFSTFMNLVSLGWRIRLVWAAPDEFASITTVAGDMSTGETWAKSVFMLVVVIVVLLAFALARWSPRRPQ